MTRVACIGEAMIELSMTGSTAGVGVAGDTLNTAIYLKRLAPDLHVDYVTALGDDPFSDQIAAFIASEDIRTHQIERLTGGSPGLYAITTDDAGERTFTYWRSAAAARQLFANGDFSALDGYDLVYLSGISLAILPPSVRSGLLDHIISTGQQLAFDSNYRPRLWESADAARAIMGAYWDAAHIALPSIDDEMDLFQETTQQVQTRWRKATCIGALKQGPEGPMSIGNQITQSYPAADTVVDTTAAGDSFNGGFLAAHLTGKDPAQALMSGHMMARQVVSQRGAIIPRDP